MRLLYYKSDVGNFGDDLNAWLWPKVFPGLLEVADQPDQGDNETWFVGFGTILTQRHLPREGRKVIFGTGVRPGYPLPDETWNLDIRFLRGPLSENSTGNQSRYITDSAALAADWKPQVARGENVGLMPYFRSTKLLDWRGCCERLGYVYVDPHGPVDAVLAAIAGLDRLVTEAMHGAIIADAFRVPWTRYRCFSHLHEKELVSEFKWQDWGSSLGVSTDFEPFPELRPKSKVGRFQGVWQDISAEYRVARALKRIHACGNFRLSDESRLENALCEMRNEARRLVGEFRR